MASRKKLPDGRVRVHLMVADENGKFQTTPGMVEGKILSGRCWTMACDPEFTAANQARKTAEPNAVTCPDCKATQTFKDTLAERQALNDEA